MQLLHMPVFTPDRELLCTSRLMRRLRLNGRGVDREAHCCRLLWTCLASMCLQPPATAPVALTPGAAAAGASSAVAGAAGVTGTSGAQHGATPASPGGDAPTTAPRGMRRQESLVSLSLASSCGGGVNSLGGGVNRLEGQSDETGARAPWWALLDELCDSLVTRLQGAALRLEDVAASSEGAPGTALGRAPGTALGAPDLREPCHLSNEAAMRSLEAAAVAEELISKGEIAKVDSGGMSVGAMGEAHARLEAEQGMLSTLGLLVHACAENGDLALALTTTRWLRVLLAMWHYASPRCMRLSMRLLAKVA